MPKAKEPGRKLSRPVVQFRAEEEWIDRVAEAAAALGMTGGVSQYVREATNRQLAVDGFGPAAAKPPAKGKKSR